jgi:hypothetical protein
MSELERELRGLGDSMAYPATPDLTSRVRQRLAERRPWWRALSRRRQGLAITLAVLAVSVAAAMAVPSARTAILRFFHIGAATVERVETLPPAQERPLTAGLGRRVSLAEGARLAGFRMLLPPLEEPVQSLYARPAMQSTLLRGPDARPVLLMEIRGRQNLDLAKKFATPQTHIEPVSVNGGFGLWIEGAPHVVMFDDGSRQLKQLTTRLAGDVLIWTRGDLTLRLEGRLTKAQALELARSVTEPAGP